MGPAAYKEVRGSVADEVLTFGRRVTDNAQVAELSGYQRAIINENPPLIDEDGYDIESDDDEEQVQDAVASALEDNPYSSIHLERPYP